MSGLLEAIHVEITRRETLRVTLTAELGLLNGQLDQLHSMIDLAKTLNGAGTVEEPAPGKTSKRASTGGRSATPGRNGGKAPSRRAKAPAGSAPSGTHARAASTNGEGGGTKRAAVLAFVQANGRVKIGDVAEEIGIAPAAAAAHLKKLRATGDVQAEGSTADRVYFAGAGTPHEAPPSPTTTPAAPVPAAADDSVDENYLDIALIRQLRKGPLTPTTAASAIDAPLDAVTAACTRLARKGALSSMEDGTYVA